jgi:hypothetical protein
MVNREILAIWSGWFNDQDIRVGIDKPIFESDDAFGLSK